MEVAWSHSSTTRVRKATVYTAHLQTPRKYTFKKNCLLHLKNPFFPAQKNFSLFSLKAFVPIIWKTFVPFTCKILCPLHLKNPYSPSILSPLHLKNLSPLHLKKLFLLHFKNPFSLTSEKLFSPSHFKMTPLLVNIIKKTFSLRRFWFQQSNIYIFLWLYRLAGNFCFHVFKVSAYDAERSPVAQSHDLHLPSCTVSLRWKSVFWKGIITARYVTLVN